jgi:Xaa-Pro aminopeptidase
VILSLLLAAAATVEAPEPAFFAAHRQALLAKLPADGIGVFAAAPESGLEVDDVYRQNSDFWYLTGLSEPDAVAVLRPGAGDGKRYVLFVRPRDPSQEQWSGSRVGVDGARQDYGADEALPIAELWDRFPQLARGTHTLLYRDGGDGAFRDKLLEAWRAAEAHPSALRPSADAAALLGQLRLVKDATEQRLLRRAAALSADAHRAAMAAVAPDRYEYALKSVMVATCLAGGAARMAYTPIVGSGPNSLILHYERADRKLEVGAMIVNDTGCEYQMYASDVTRSYPVSGRFTADQKAIYEIVLAAQKAGFAKVKPGVPFRDVHAATVDVVVDGLLKLGILSGDRDEIIRSRSFQKFYPHGASHWIGLNTHDAGSYGYPEGVTRLERYGKATTALAPGMALTVEPGIYIAPDSTPDKRWWNIGVRIEDTVLVTPNGMECLSCGAPRELAEVEKALGPRP